MLDYVEPNRRVIVSFLRVIIIVYFMLLVVGAFWAFIHVLDCMQPIHCNC